MVVQGFEPQGRLSLYKFPLLIIIMVIIIIAVISTASYLTDKGEYSVLYKINNAVYITNLKNK